MRKAPIISKRSGNPVDRHIGMRIRSRQLALGKSQEWLGDQLGLTYMAGHRRQHCKDQKRLGHTSSPAIGRKWPFCAALGFPRKTSASKCKLVLE